jgi:hypothetical protein
VCVCACACVLDVASGHVDGDGWGMGWGRECADALLCVPYAEEEGERRGGTIEPASEGGESYVLVLLRRLY